MAGSTPKTMAWELMDCLFPGVETPVRNTSTPSSFDKGEESGANIRTEMNPALNKRGNEIFPC